MIIHEYLVRIYQDEMLAQAEQIRLISRVKRRSYRVNSFYTQTMAWLGNVMCSWGSQLVRRFGKKTDSFQSGAIEQKLNA